MKTGIIYAARCVATGRSYIGQTTQSLTARRQQHEHEALVRRSVGCVKFYRALRKYGAASFTWLVVAADVPLEQLDDLEAKNIASFGSADDGYNVCRNGITTRGLKLSAETRARMSQAKRPPRTAEHNAKLAAARRGKKMSPEARQRIGDAKRGIKWSEEVVEKRAAKNRGRKRHPQEIARFVASRMANGGWRSPKWTEERRAKFSALMKNRVFTDEHRRRISEAKRAAAARQTGAA